MNTSEIMDVIARCSRDVLPHLTEHAFQRSDRLEELGANSLDRAEVLVMVMETLAVSVPRIELANRRNLGELADCLHARLV